MRKGIDNMTGEVIKKDRTTVFSVLMVAVSLIAGSIGCFYLYIRSYMKANDEIAQRIDLLLENINVYENKKSIFILLIAAIGMTVFWVAGFIIYKIIFKLAKVQVNDPHLLMALGSAYTLSFLIGSFVIGMGNIIAAMLITNVVEIAVVYMALFDKIKTGIVTCVTLRLVITVFNLLFFATV